MQTVPVLTNDEIQEDRPMPSRNHARVALNITLALDRIKDRFSVYPQLTVDLDGWSTIPDLALYAKGALPDDWLTDDEEVNLAPHTVIEILSPKQNLQPLVDKVRNYLSHGVKSCWIIVPGLQTVSLFPASGGSKTFAEGQIIRDDSLGFEITHKELFA